jgi:hypothetical protein
MTGDQVGNFLAGMESHDGQRNRSGICTKPPMVAADRSPLRPFTGLGTTLGGLMHRCVGIRGYLICCSRRLRRTIDGIAPGSGYRRLDAIADQPGLDPGERGETTTGHACKPAVQTAAGAHVELGTMKGTDDYITSSLIRAEFIGAQAWVQRLRKAWISSPSRTISSGQPFTCLRSGFALANSPISATW